MGGINFPMLSDFWPHGAVCQLYDYLRPQGMPKRAVFIIDRNGVIEYSETNDDARALPNFEKVKAKLAELK